MITVNCLAHRIPLTAHRTTKNGKRSTENGERTTVNEQLSLIHHCSVFNRGEYSNVFDVIQIYF